MEKHGLLNGKPLFRKEDWRKEHKTWQVDVAKKYTVHSKSLWRALVGAAWIYFLYKIGRLEEPPTTTTENSNK